MKKIALMTLAAAAFVFAGTSAAFANFGPHGGYATDTDACAECHRAHTAISSVTWTDNQGGQKNALLISSSTSMTDFCDACHGDAAPGANTDVVSGFYDGDPTGTNSVQGATLNGGGFSKLGGMSGATVSSSHNVSGSNPTSLIRWGYVSGANSDLSAMSAFTCTDCHDPHGSSNYRLLKDVVNGVTVGGYAGANNTPQPTVISDEQGYPSGGWAKGSDGAAQMAVYKPNYTSAQYAQNKLVTNADGTTTGGSMSAWCSACHTVYSQSDSEYNYGGKISGTAGAQSTMYHRHPIDVPLSVGTQPNAGDRALITQLVDDPGLPLEMGSGLHPSTFSYGATTGIASQSWDDRGNISCLTCHRAHGTAAQMSGWAATSLDSNGLPKTVASGTGNTAPAQDASGTDPVFDSALLRYDNRGVCERCHNK